MVVLPPGTILQLTFLRHRIRKLNLSTFVEVGPGNGNITELLLNLGMSGIVFEISNESIFFWRNVFKRKSEITDCK
jgi:16S rRNA A1518/A1519 N6-dimethyltransferase RsmA/KsgA/DIM1 with predicted DNA glycosylase/AP lyase activity